MSFLHSVKLYFLFQFPLGRYVYRTPNTNPEDVNTAVVNYYQHGPVNFRDMIILDVLEVRYLDNLSLLHDNSFTYLKQNRLY